MKKFNMMNFQEKLMIVMVLIIASVVITIAFFILKEEPVVKPVGPVEVPQDLPVVYECPEGVMCKG